MAKILINKVSTGTGSTRKPCYGIWLRICSASASNWAAVVRGHSRYLWQPNIILALIFTDVIWLMEVCRYWLLLRIDCDSEYKRLAGRQFRLWNRIPVWLPIHLCHLMMIYRLKFTMLIPFLVWKELLYSDGSICGGLNINLTSRMKFWRWNCMNTINTMADLSCA